MRAGIVDYGMGNLASVAKALERVGADTMVSENGDELSSSDVVVVPGVGNFAAGISNLARRGLDSFIGDWAASKRPLLGICLGLQLFFDRSEEGDTKGLGIIGGEVVRLPDMVKVPHMGWNEISASGSSLFEKFSGDRFYFVHSYVPVPTAFVGATTSYGGDFASAVESENVVGTQFHPEKSSDSGLRLLEVILEKFA